MALAPGTKLGPYEIQSPLGAGGMGEVYRATDTKLGRDVALKVLPADMPHDAERFARFRREAKALAQLDHPNIVTIHSVEECGGVHFLTMQLVEGQALDRLIPAGGLPVEQIVEIASALGDALAAAHEKGIVHRDLKPANVMVSNEGRVKVLDFGLAKDIRAANLSDATMTSDSRTQIGVVMGTPAYMSPEQTSGRPLDHRTDIFSLGVVLHEMATGQRPFDGSSSAELVSAILRDTAPSVTDVRPDLPGDLARIVRRCLEKDPRHRLQTARDVSNEFRDLARQTSQKLAPASQRTGSAAVSGATRADEDFWVAVLPFKYAGMSAEPKALADGLLEEIITGLSRFSYLRVITGGSTQPYRDQSPDLRAVGKELGARYVMSGNLRQVGARLRVAVQLVDAATGAQLWSETYERPFSAESVFELQDDLAARIAATVGDAHGILAHSMSEALRDKAPDQLTPYEAVLRSFGYGYRQTPEEHAAVRDALELAVEKAPGNADAWSMLTRVYMDEFAHGTNLRPDALDRMLQAARRALDAAPSSAMAYGALAYAMFFRKEFQAFRTAAEQSIALNPLNTPTVAGLGALMAYTGDWERGCTLVERAMQLNPRHPGWYWTPLYCNAYRKRDYREAVNCAIKFNLPGFHVMHEALAAAYGQLGEQERAAASLREVFRLRPDYATAGRERLEKWFDPEFVAHFMEGLHKAGWNIPAQAVAAAPASASKTGSVRTASGATRADEGFWVAVLPFRYTGSDAALKALAEGSSDEIITGLSRFSYLRVIARGSTAKYSSESGDVRTVGKELGARYIMEGNLRQSGTKLRLAVQLVDAVSGAHLWAETYERTFSPETVFELQDDLVPRIVSTVADQYGVLPRSMSEALRGKSEYQLTPHEAVLRAFRYFTRITPEEHAVLGKILERAVREAPDHADSWAMLSMIYRGEFAQGFNAGPNPLDRALAAAQRAVDLAATHALGHYALATVYFFRKEMVPFRVEAARALALNPLDASVRAYLGLLIAAAGEWDRGCQMVESAMLLNPNCPGYFYFARCCNGYRQGRYAEMLEDAARVNMPGYFHTHALRAAALGQLGRREEARKAVQDLLALRPDFAAAARQEYAKWYDSELIEQLIDGLRKAGLEIPEEARPAAVALKSEPSSAPDSGALRADEGFWVAVLPFKNSGGNAYLTALAEGLTEDIVTGLSRFSYLRVIARSSTAKYSSESGDVRSIGKELGARYVMEGSLRQAGLKLRLAVRLVDAASGAHLWAETYDRAFAAEEIFELQDDLVPRIVSTIADTHGVLPYSMHQTLRNKNPDDLSPYEALLRGFAYFKHVNAADHAGARAALEKAVGQAAGNADCWAMLSMLYREENNHGFNVRPDPVGRALGAARRAVDAAPSNHLAHHALASVLFFRRERQAFRSAAQRAIELNPMDGFTIGYMGFLISFSGDWERGCALMEKARNLNPNHPGWYWFPPFFNAYRKGDYRGALEFALRVNMPGFWRNELALAATYGQLGELELARNAARELLAVRPDFAAVAWEECRKWWEPELVRQIIEGVRKAGLEIGDKPEGETVP